MAELIDVYRGSVQTWECDQMGHLNVQFYVEKATSALAVFGERIGLGPVFVRQQGAKLVAHDQHIRFLREQHPGAALAIRAGVLEAGPQEIRVYLEMISRSNGEVAATFVTRAHLADIGTRETRSIPAHALDAAGALRCDLPAHGQPRGLEPYPPRQRPTRDEARQRGMPVTYLNTVSPAQCDSQGFMATRHYMGIVAEAVPNLLVEAGGDDRSRGRIGGAALEYRFVYHQAPREGDVITLHSAVKEVGPKAYKLGHWLLDASTGEALATSEAVVVLFDLDARKAITIPDDRRAALEGLIVPDLSV
ncbi:thioesterase family protein [Halomonas shantousis]